MRYVVNAEKNELNTRQILGNPLSILKTQWRKDQCKDKMPMFLPPFILTVGAENQKQPHKGWNLEKENLLKR